MREALHHTLLEGEEYKLFWQKQSEFVRVAARFGAKIISFVAVGEDDIAKVPKGLDKLFVSIISVETGKTIAKSGKASVRNANCRWTEAISEFVYISREEATKELEQCLLKLIVATGSTRSGILGEATVNLACYMSSKTSVPVSLPLNKCNHGTTLQVKIQCLSPVTNFRDEKYKKTITHIRKMLMLTMMK